MGNNLQTPKHRLAEYADIPLDRAREMYSQYIDRVSVTYPENSTPAQREQILLSSIAEAGGVSPQQRSWKSLQDFYKKMEKENDNQSN